MMSTPPVQARLLFYLVGIRPRPEWRPWAEGVVISSWHWIVAVRLGVAALMGVFLLTWSGDFGWAYMLGFTLVWFMVVLALGAAFVGGKRGRARAIARIRGTRRSGPAQLAVSAASLLYVTLLLLTANGRRWSTELLDELQ